MGNNNGGKRAAQQESQLGDFKPTDLAIAEHEKTLGNLDGRIKSLEKKIGTSEQVAETFAQAAGSQLRLQDMLKNVFKKLVENDKDVRAAVTKVAEEVQDSRYKRAMKHFGGKIVVAIWYLIGVLTPLLVDWIKDLASK